MVKQRFGIRGWCLTRRDILASGLFLIGSRLRASQPWEGRKPAEWTPDDIVTILDRSGWARDATMEASAASLDPSNGKGKKRVAAATGLADKRIFPDYKILVRWESGLPLRLARRDSSPLAADRTHYVLSMSRLPVSLIAVTSNPGKGAEALDETAIRAQIADQVARSTTLQCPNKPPIHAGRTEWVQSGFEYRLTISIPHGDHPIQLEDGAVAFVSEFGDFIVRTSFLLNRMRYKGNLEL